MSTETDHDILIEVRNDLKHLINAHEELKLELHESVIPRISSTEASANRWLGRDGAIVAGISLFITLVTAGIINLKA